MLEVLASAAGTGEILVVIYHGGRSPGAKRNLIIQKISGDVVHAREPGRDKTAKTYSLNLLELATHDSTAPWKDDLEFNQITPSQHFHNWTYIIQNALWPALGVSKREYIDPIKTKEARAAAKARGVNGPDSSRITIKYLAHVIRGIPQYDFHAGDTFHHRNGADSLQVAAEREFLEIHQWVAKSTKIKAYHLTAAEFAKWLQFGGEPLSNRIDPALSYSSVLRFSIMPLDA